MVFTLISWFHLTNAGRDSVFSSKVENAGNVEGLGYMRATENGYGVNIMIRSRSRKMSDFVANDRVSLPITGVQMRST